MEHITTILYVHYDWPSKLISCGLTPDHGYQVNVGIHIIFVPTILLTAFLFVRLSWVFDV
jgi:hypothetical protein